MDAEQKIMSARRSRNSLELYRNSSRATVGLLNSDDHISTQQLTNEQKKQERCAKREENISLMEAFRRGLFFATDDKLQFPHYSDASLFYMLSSHRAHARLCKLIAHEEKKDKQEYQKNLESIITWIEEHSSTYEKLPVLVTAMPGSYKKRLEVRLVIDFKKSAEGDDEVSNARKAIFEAFKKGSPQEIVRVYQQPFHSTDKPICTLQDEVQFRLAQLAVFKQQK